MCSHDSGNMSGVRCRSNTSIGFGKIHLQELYTDEKEKWADETDHSGTAGDYNSDPDVEQPCRGECCCKYLYGSSRSILAIRDRCTSLWSTDRAGPSGRHHHLEVCRLP